MSLTLQSAGLILLALNAPTAIGQIHIFPPWWTVLAASAIALPAIATLILGIWTRARTLQMLSGIQAVAFVAALWLVPLALGGSRMPPGSGMPWLVQISVIAGSAAALRWGPKGAVAYGIVLQATVFALVFVGAGDPVPGPALGDAIFGLFYVTLFTSLAFTLKRSGAVLDETMASAIAEARAGASADATRAARGRVATMIHDTVIVALLTYGAQSGRNTAVISEAKHALASIDALDIVRPAQDRTPLDLAYELQAITTEHDTAASFDFRLDRELPIPSEVSDAFVEATSEALRNSVRHAPVGRSVTREVHVVLSDPLIEVLVLDDGVGFAQNSVAATRLGVRHGIIGRLESVTGGSAMVTSTPGYGTVVALRWEPR